MNTGKQVLRQTRPVLFDKIKNTIQGQYIIL